MTRFEMQIRRAPGLAAFLVATGLLAGYAFGAEQDHFIDRLAQFHLLYDRDPDQETALLAHDLLKELTLYAGSDKATFAYYIAECQLHVGNPDGARATIEEAGPDARHGVNAGEYVRLLYRLERDRSTPATRKATTTGPRSEYLRQIARIYPSGSAADRLMVAESDAVGDLTVEQQIRRGGRPEFHGARNIDAVRQAAAQFASMHMFSEAFHLYRCAAGLLSDQEWCTPQAAPIWLGAGDCLRDAGQPKLALEYYFKAAASGGSPSEVSSRIQAANASIKSASVSQPPSRAPDPHLLRNIATSCTQSELFAEALAAARVGNKDGVTKADLGLLAHIHREKGRVFQAVIDAYGEGAMFRGERVSHESVALEYAAATQISEESDPARR
jgi:tetratricopeptide (TPR) repeat protein